MAGVKGRGRPKGVKDKAVLSPRVPLGRKRRSYMSSPSEDPDVVVTERTRISSRVPTEVHENYKPKLPKKTGRPKGATNTGRNSLQHLYKNREKILSPAFRASKFQDGNPGGPGRPKGCRNKLTLVLAQIGEESAESVFKKLIDLALGNTKDGDAKACKAVMDTIMALRKVTPINFELHKKIETTEDLNTFSRKIINMTAEGELSAEEAMEYGKVCEQELKMMTDTEVVKKIENTCQLVDIIKNKG